MSSANGCKGDGMVVFGGYLPSFLKTIDAFALRQFDGKSPFRTVEDYQVLP